MEVVVHSTQTSSLFINETINRITISFEESLAKKYPPKLIIATIFQACNTH